MSACTRRLAKEIKNFVDEPIDGIDANPEDDNIFVWVGFIDGPLGSPYENGRFKLKITIPHDYPFTPLKISDGTK